MVWAEWLLGVLLLVLVLVALALVTSSAPPLTVRARRSVTVWAGRCSVMRLKG